MGQQQGAIRFFEDHAADFSLLAELTDLNIYLGHRGRLYWDITSIGKAAHTCHRHLAVNAIAKMVPLIEEVEALRYMPDLPEWVAELFGPELYTAVGRIYGGLPPGGPSMIPDECTIRVDSRPQPGVEESEVEALILGAVERALARDPEARYDVVLADRKRPHLIDRDHPLTVALDQAYRSVTGRGPGVRRRILAGRHCEHRPSLPDRDLRSGARARLHAERVARRRGHRDCGEGEHGDGGDPPGAGMTAARLECLAALRVLAATCGGVKPGERSLIVTDSAAEQAIVSAMADTLGALGLDVAIVSSAPAELPGDDPPGPVSAAMLEADVIFELTSVFIGSCAARRRACEQGARYLTVPGPDLDDAPSTRPVRGRFRGDRRTGAAPCASGSTRRRSSI